MDIEPKTFLQYLFKAAVEAANPHNILGPHLPINRSGNAIVIGAGKAAATMAQSFEDHWQGNIKGVVVTPYGHGATCKYIDVVEASHPSPDVMSVKAAKRIISLTQNLSEDNNVFVLLSGGGSSLLCLPASDIDFFEKQNINKALLKSGATIDEINCVRKHLSAIKGGKLARHCFPATLYTYAISDVMGDDPSVIASGPTVGDPSTSSDALKILLKYNILNNVSEWLENLKSETIKPDDPVLNNSHYKIIFTAKDMLSSVDNKDFDIINLGEQNGEARALAKTHAEIALKTTATKPTILISGGETTVTVKGTGRGGRNSEYLLALAITLEGKKNIYALAADTDGIDGMEDNAGAIMTPDTLKRAKELKMNLQSMLDNNDSYTAFKKLGDLITTGPTRTNVNDFRAILIMPDN